VQVGDIVRLMSDGATGIIIEYEPNQETLLDSMFPYHIHFFDEIVSDWFGSSCLEVISAAG